MSDLEALLKSIQHRRSCQSMKTQRKYYTRIFMFVVYSSWICQGEATAVNAQGCRALQFVSPREGKALVNHVIKNVSVGSSDVCEIECYLDNRCLSYNYGDRGNVRHKCELSDSDHKQHPNDLQERLGYIYRGTEYECSNNPCSLNGKCVIDVADNKYRCHCHPGYYGDHCEQVVLVEWKKISDAPVCFGARDNKCGVFTIKENGLIDTFKLVHASGSGARCNYYTLASYWGCENRQDGRDTLLTVITFSNNTALPIASYSKEVGITGGLCSYYTYKINGTSSDSKELIFEGLHSPLWVTIGQEFRIWHGQDLTGCSEINNSGQTCADVYAWYTH